MCLVFPSAHPDATTKKAVVQVSCSWNYSSFQFQFTAAVIELFGLIDHIKTILLRQKKININNTFKKYFFKLNPDRVNQLSLFRDRFTFNSQYPAKSLVLDVSPVDHAMSNQVMKFVSSGEFANLMALRSDLRHAPVVHDSETIFLGVDLPLILLYEKCIRPLTPMEARSCLVDFIEKLWAILDELHTRFHYEHCDLQLENICFCRNSDGRFKIVLIDLVFAKKTTSPNWKSGLKSLPSYSCMYRKIDNVQSVDYHQLGYMIVWICQYGKAVLHGLKKSFLFKGNAAYHKMDILGQLAYKNDTFVEKLVNEGELLTLCISCVHDFNIVVGVFDQALFGASKFIRENDGTPQCLLDEKLV